MARAATKSKPTATKPPKKHRSKNVSDDETVPAMNVSTSDLAATYAALILADAESEITSDKILTLTTAAGVEIEPIWATLLAKALEGKNVKEMLSTIGVSSGPAAISTATATATTAAEPEPAAADDGNDSDDSDGGMFGGGLFD
ncbi:60s acidic ribosomal protein-domain-containing protein [Mycena vitilis]|nr:60s acidic ribosomal protein-domain-containing protein [Mycena vitilis]